MLGQVVEPEAVCAAFDAGINFFFVSGDLHWPGYEPVRRGLEMLLDRGPHIREQIVVGGVSYVTQPEFCHGPFYELLESVRGLERLDLTIIGGAYAGDFLIRSQVYEDHRRADAFGTRALGASFHDRDASHRAMNGNLLDIAFVRYNPRHPGAARDVFPRVKTFDGLMYNFKSVYGPTKPKDFEAIGVGEANWRPHPTDYYRFALTSVELDGLLVSVRTANQIPEIAEALSRGPLTDDEHQYMLQLGELDRGDAVVELNQPAVD